MSQLTATSGILGFGYCGNKGVGRTGVVDVGGLGVGKGGAVNGGEGGGGQCRLSVVRKRQCRL